MNKLIIAAGLALGALSPLAQAQTVLTTSLFTPPHHPMSKAIGAWCDDVAQATEKRVRCNILPKAVAGPAGAFDAVRDGVADVTFSVHGYTPGRYVLTELSEFPFGSDSAEANSVAYQKIYEQHLAPLNEHKGLKVLTVFTHGPGNPYNSKMKVDSLSDLQKLKWRVGGGIVNELGNQLGANVTLKPVTESFSLLSTGVIDGVWLPTGSVASFGLGDLVKHRTAFPGGLYNTSFAMVMNPDAWSRISKKDQQAIEKLNGQALAARLGKAWDADDAEARKKLQEKGVVFTKAPEPFINGVKQATQKIEQGWVERAKKAGLKDPAAVLQAYRDEVAQQEKAAAKQ
jgi:TRAP-type C4-dicarboxylate transport system substrate-binding protein